MKSISPQIVSSKAQTQAERIKTFADREVILLSRWKQCSQEKQVEEKPLWGSIWNIKLLMTAFLEQLWQMEQEERAAIGSVQQFSLQMEAQPGDYANIIIGLIIKGVLRKRMFFQRGRRQSSEWFRRGAWASSATQSWRVGTPRCTSASSPHHQQLR